MPAHQSQKQEPTFGLSQPEPHANPYAPPKASVESKVPTKTNKGKLLPHQKAGRVIRLMAWLGIAATVGIGAAVLLPAQARGGSLPSDLVAMLLICAVLVVALFFVAGAVMRYKTWGRYAGIVYGLLSLLGFPLGTLIVGYVLWQLIFGWAEGAAEA
jgi:hypothetical protein